MKTVKLSDVLIIKYGKDHKNLDNGNIPVYGSGGLMRMVDNYLYDGESVLIPRKGSLNNVQFVSGKFWTVDTLFWTIINSNLIRPKYLYYILKQLNFLSMNVGSAVPSLTASILYPIEITIPSLDIQDKILLKILPIESKICLNKQINDNLLEILSTHFIKYIVSNQAKIPDGWKTFKLKDLSDVQNGFAFKSSEYVDHSELPIIRTKNFNENSLVETNDLKYISNSSKEKYKKFRFQSLDTVMVMVGASIGKTALITTRNLPGLQNQNMWRFRSKLSEYPEMLIFELVNYINAQVGGSATGSAREFYRKTIFQEFEIALPKNSEELDIYSSIGKKIDSLASETQRLTELRDALLPKLLNGEISLSN